MNRRTFLLGLPLVALLPKLWPRPWWTDRHWFTAGYDGAVAWEDNFNSYVDVETIMKEWKLSPEYLANRRQWDIRGRKIT